MYEKLESCPECGADFKQAEYDGQFCCACGWQHGQMELADLKEEINGKTRNIKRASNKLR